MGAPLTIKFAASAAHTAMKCGQPPGVAFMLKWLAAVSGDFGYKPVSDHQE